MTAASLTSADYERALSAVGLGDVAVFHRETTGSTNDDARALAAEALSPKVALVVAEEQTRGRGRGANVWLSPRGSISFTLTLPDIDAARLGVLPLGVGASVVGALRRLGAAATVKWPNDVLIDDRKVCGILCESSVLKGTARAFLGIGINVESASLDREAAPEAGALDASGLEVDRPALVADITARVLRLLREASDRSIVEDWKAVSVPWWGEVVSIIEGEVETRLTLLDVSPDGQLVVRDEAGAIRSLVSGQIRRLRVAGA